MDEEGGSELGDGGADDDDIDSTDMGLEKWGGPMLHRALDVGIKVKKRTAAMEKADPSPWWA